RIIVSMRSRAGQFAHSVSACDVSQTHIEFAARVLTPRRMIALARVGAFLKLGRPHFLLGGFSSFALGSALAVAAGAHFVWSRYAWAQATITSAQWMTHYSNDYFDLEADRANSTPTRWSGGSR